MIRKIIEATFPSAASITFRISSGRARSVNVVPEQHRPFYC
jgi:hypothetical protein